jgi:hypothetical protein
VSHLTLKAFFHVPGDGPFFDLIDAFWDHYCAAIADVVAPPDLAALTQRGILNLAGCSLARLDGKSKIEYLNDDARRESVRALCRAIFAGQLKQWSDIRILARELLAPKSGFRVSSSDASLEDL